jgi:two-component system, chemotaxis family, CheB/CheR fusion protein
MARKPGKPKHKAAVQKSKKKGDRARKGIGGEDQQRSPNLEREKRRSEGKGLVMAQDPASTKHPDMPSAAIATGCVDFVVSAADIAEELVRIDGHPYIQSSVRKQGGLGEEAAEPGGADQLLADQEQKFPETSLGNPQDLRRILLVLRNVAGVDFSSYKPATVQRRIQRRMALLRIENLSEYARFLQENEAEALALYHDILIKVTSFFRDPLAYQFLRKKVFPRIFKDRTQNEPVRIWVPGCSTGEEAYSLAILLAEFLGRRRVDYSIQIFGTDLSEVSLNRAREGKYLENIALDVSPERLRRFFSGSGRNYQISKSIREMVVFARQNLAKDPPFSRLDLISCRNVLIYLGVGLQRKVFPIFHYALRPGGFLVLGNSETVGGFTDLFTPMDKKTRVFLRKNDSSRPQPQTSSANFGMGELKPPNLEAAPAVNPRQGRTAPTEAGGEEPQLVDLQREANRIVLQQYSPPGMVVTGDLDVVYFFGQGHQFFEPAEGKASLNLQKILKEGLTVHVRVAISAARRNSRVFKKIISYTDQDRTMDVGLEVTPLKRDRGRVQHFLIVLRQMPEMAAKIVRTGAQETTAAGRDGPEKSRNSRNLERLRQELVVTRRSLQKTIEEQDASNQEIKSANEEILSSNEELQSTNEELETSNEELQSSNEELVTVNEELQNRNIELAQANNDIANLVNSVDFAIIMLGADYRIRRFTSAAARLFNLIPSDVGRPFSDINSNLEIADLGDLIGEAINKTGGKEMDVRDHQGRWYRLSIRPYRTADNRIEGAVLAVVDVDPLKKGMEELKASRDFSEAVVAGMSEPLLVLETGLRVRSANPAFYETFQLTPEMTIGKTVSAIGRGEWNNARLRKLLVQVLDQGNRLDGFVFDHEFWSVGRKRLLLDSRQIAAEGERSSFLLLTIHDITERRRIEHEILSVGDREQRRMAQDLHDGLGQQLTAIGFLAQGLLNRLDPSENPGLAEDVKNIGLQVRKAVGITHDLTRGLHPMQLETDHFKTAMQGLASNVENLFKIVCAFHFPEPFCPPRNKEEATHLYRITQEAINNALKHGKATHLSAEYRHDTGSESTILAIHDDGVGIRKIPPPGTAGNGMGLQIMRYRAEAIGGRLRIEPDANGGTSVTVTIPGEKNEAIGV